MKIGEFVDLARAWSNMGDAVTAQLDAILDGAAEEDQNPNALRMIAGFLAQAGTAGVDTEGLVDAAGGIGGWAGRMTIRYGFAQTGKVIHVVDPWPYGDGQVALCGVWLADVRAARAGGAGRAPLCWRCRQKAQDHGWKI